MSSKELYIKMLDDAIERLNEMHKENLRTIERTDRVLKALDRKDPLSRPEARMVYS